MKTRLLLISLIVCFAVLVPSTLAFSYVYELSLKQQIQNGLAFDEILCPNPDHVLTERPNGKLACVTSDTAKHFDWKIQDEVTAVNLRAHNNPAVKNCQPGWDSNSPPKISLAYGNHTHVFNSSTCEWREK